MPELLPHLRKPRLRPDEAAQYLQLVHGIRLKTSYLAKLRCVGGGPAFQYSCRSPLYPTDRLDFWASQRLSGVVERVRDRDRSA
jgi:hypothetical protein